MYLWVRLKKEFLLRQENTKYKNDNDVHLCDDLDKLLVYTYIPKPSNQVNQILKLNTLPNKERPTLH